jgi:hypothetical protein
MHIRQRDGAGGDPARESGHEPEFVQAPEPLSRAIRASDYAMEEGFLNLSNTRTPRSRKLLARGVSKMSSICWDRLINRHRGFSSDGVPLMLPLTVGPCCYDLPLSCSLAPPYSSSSTACRMAFRIKKK